MSNNTRNLVKQLKEAGQDENFYPTTDEILSVVKADIQKHFKSHSSCVYSYDNYSILDCGAGDGRSLNKLAHERGDKYAIEKSPILINQLSNDTYIIGTEFNECTLIDKEVDVLFCNPPYNDYEAWASKIIQEANAKHIYLVIPDRWDNSNQINNALKLREVEAKTLGSFDFLNSDRAARAHIDILHINLLVKGYRERAKVEPFDVWFNQNFKIEKAISETEEEHKEKIKTGIVQSGNLIKTLVDLYNVDMSELNETFTQVSSLNASVLKELDVDVISIKKALKQRIKGLKNKYWEELFSNYTVINKRLTTRSLVSMKKRLFNHTSVEFTATNCYAITGWVINNANEYFDSQLIYVVENMVSDCNILKYKSNQRVFKSDDWRYTWNDHKKTLRDYGLDLRCVMSGQDGVYVGRDFNCYNHNFVNGLGKRGASTVNNLIVIANNLNIACDMRIESMTNWSECNNQDVIDDNGDILMNVKAYKNGNLHIKFNKKFIRKLNVEFGRLKGWLKDKQQASEELNIPEKDIDFTGNTMLGGSDLLMLGVD